MEEKESVFERLLKLDVSDHIEKKVVGKDRNGKDRELSYLSWPWAVAEMTKAYPGFSYEIVEHDGLPYMYDPKTGYMVMTRITVNGQTKSMWLPVMDSANNAMKSEPYTIHTKYKEIPVQAATMFDINTALMRCFVKNCAMFGLGLSLFVGEDTWAGEDEISDEIKAIKPEPSEEYVPPKDKKPSKVTFETAKEVREDSRNSAVITDNERRELFAMANEAFDPAVRNEEMTKLIKGTGAESSKTLTHGQFESIRQKLNAMIDQKLAG